MSTLVQTPYNNLYLEASNASVFKKNSNESTGSIFYATFAVVSFAILITVGLMDSSTWPYITHVLPWIIGLCVHFAATAILNKPLQNHNVVFPHNT